MMRWSDSIIPTTANETFWEALAQRVLLACHCRMCDTWSYYPRHICPTCGALEPALEPLVGVGHVYTITTVRRPLFDDWGPDSYDVALVDMDEGVRLMGRLVGVDAGATAIGDRVEIVFLDVDHGKTWYGFTAATREAP